MIFIFLRFDLYSYNIKLCRYLIELNFEDVVPENFRDFEIEV